MIIYNNPSLIQENLLEHMNKNINLVKYDISIFNQNYKGRLIYKPLSNNYFMWVNSILPNTRIIIEPLINGYIVALKYNKGIFKKAISKYGKDISPILSNIKYIPTNIDIIKEIHVLGIITNILPKDQFKKEILETYDHILLSPYSSFIAFQIMNCELNHYSQVSMLSKLGFITPPNEFTRKNITELDLYIKIMKESSLFLCDYPTKGLILKVNSRKLQKQMGTTNTSVNWLFSISN